jgi:oligopeptide/dipeptide ABC transporter ATP-binding protein
MYLGRIVEIAQSDELYHRPRMPYTAALLSAVPKGHSGANAAQRVVLEGDVPSPIDPPSGCPFHPRCPKAREVGGGKIPENCQNDMPPLGEVDPKHFAACWYPVEKGEGLDKAAHV